jgi:hypothetical protein
MSDGIQFDYSEFAKLAADIEAAPKTAAKNVQKAVEVTARNVKDAWKEKLSGATKLPKAAGSITYDVKGGAGIRADVIEAEIGPDNSRGQGAVVGKTEFGSPGLSPRGYGHGALQENEKDFERGLSIAIGDAL